MTGKSMMFLQELCGVQAWKREESRRIDLVAKLDPERSPVM